jgi:chromosome segregation ATPase
MLRHISKKHKHLKELIYREEHERYLDNKREMSVQLNLLLSPHGSQQQKQVAVQRLINPQGKSEYFVNGLPMLLEDYLQKITGSFETGGLNLNVNNFCIYQGKLEELLLKAD